MLVQVLAAAAALQPTRTLPSTSRSTALPFYPRPAHLDGTMVGDVGFDPLGLGASSQEELARLRQAELRHGRLAMVATWGWPIAELGFAAAKRLIPPQEVCTGTGCLVDAPLAASSLTLPQIGAASIAWWGGLLTIAIVGELRAKNRGIDEPVADNLGLWTNADAIERTRLELAEIKHGRLAMVALLIHWSSKLQTALGGKSGFTFAHQLWGETCVVNLFSQKGLCYPQDVQTFDFVLSWEILFRVFTGYFAEPYF